MFLNFLKSSGTRVDYNSLLSDRSLRRDSEKFFKKTLQYVRKICKGNILNHFLINENTTSLISMGSKKKIAEHMNSSRAGGSSARVLYMYSFLAGDPRED